MPLKLCVTCTVTQHKVPACQVLLCCGSAFDWLTAEKWVTYSKVTVFLSLTSGLYSSTEIGQKNYPNCLEGQSVCGSNGNKE